MLTKIGRVVFDSKIRVTDPCYSPGTWCSYVMENCREGLWDASVDRVNKGDWGMRNMMIEIRHVDHKDNKLKFKKVPDADIGVDSGQAGFFVEKLYPDNPTEFKYENDTFYGKMCDLTLGDEFKPDPNHPHAGCNIFGCATRSGFGDGGYNLAVSRDEDGKIIAARIYFG